MIKKVINFELKTFLPYFERCCIILLSLGLFIPLFGSIPSLTNANDFNARYTSSNIISYLNILYLIALGISLLLFGIVIHDFINKHVLSVKGRVLSLLPIKRSILLLTLSLVIFLWSVLLLFVYFISVMMALGIFSLLNIQYQGLYSTIYNSDISSYFALRIVTYIFLIIVIVLITLISSFIANMRRFKRFNYLFFIIFFILLILGCNGIIYLLLLPVYTLWLKYIVIILISSSISIFAYYYASFIFSNKIETK